jgi:hypothetical protein
MTSDRQMEANRRNARKSTGPDALLLDRFSPLPGRSSLLNLIQETCIYSIERSIEPLCRL